MSSKVIRTFEDEEKMHEHFMELMSHVKPISHDIDCITILKRVKPAYDYQRLMIKNKGNKHEKHYRQRRYIAEKESIMHLEYYVKKLKA